MDLSCIAVCVLLSNDQGLINLVDESVLEMGSHLVFLWLILKLTYNK